MFSATHQSLRQQMYLFYILLVKASKPCRSGSSRLVRPALPHSLSQHHLILTHSIHCSFLVPAFRRSNHLFNGCSPSLLMATSYKNPNISKYIPNTFLKLICSVLLCPSHLDLDQTFTILDCYTAELVLNRQKYVKSQFCHCLCNPFAVPNCVALRCQVLCHQEFRNSTVLVLYCTWSDCWWNLRLEEPVEERWRREQCEAMPQENLGHPGIKEWKQQEPPAH